VLVTVPLGVLKAGHIRFEPGLPHDKQSAIARLGFGTLNKVALSFPNVFWDEEIHYIGIAGINGPDLCEWVNLYPVNGAPILVGLAVGDAGRRLDHMDDSSIYEHAMGRLRGTFGYGIPEPQGMAVSRWTADPYALGSYVHMAPGSSLEDCKTLAQPVDERGFFAGEHTNHYYPATVHGAYLSGARAAEEMAEYV
jgi:monoamine oxidase